MGNGNWVNNYIAKSLRDWNPPARPKGDAPDEVVAIVPLGECTVEGPIDAPWLRRTDGFPLLGLLAHEPQAITLKGLSNGPYEVKLVVTRKKAQPDGE